VHFAHSMARQNEVIKLPRSKAWRFLFSSQRRWRRLLYDPNAITIFSHILPISFFIGFVFSSIFYALFREKPSRDEFRPMFGNPTELNAFLFCFLITPTYTLKLNNSKISSLVCIISWYTALLLYVYKMKTVGKFG
jgi:hypothetical protein